VVQVVGRVGSAVCLRTALTEPPLSRDRQRQAATRQGAKTRDQLENRVGPGFPPGPGNQHVSCCSVLCAQRLTMPLELARDLE